MSVVDVLYVTLEDIPLLGAIDVVVVASKLILVPVEVSLAESNKDV